MPFFLTKIFGSTKALIAGAIAILVPIIYLFGRKDGANAEKTAVLEDEINAQNERADFYKDIGEQNSEIEANAPRNRSELTERLRKHGL
jgi:hypothetical protein